MQQFEPFCLELFYKVPHDGGDDKLFSWYGWPTKTFSLICSQANCPKSSPSQISNTPQAGIEPVQMLKSDFVEWSCVVVRTTTPRRHNIHKKIILLLTLWFPKIIILFY